MPRLYSDLRAPDGSRYYYNLESAPGGITNSAPAVITLFGRAAVIQELTIAFRTPETALITIIGREPLSSLILTPAVATITLGYPTPAVIDKHISITNDITPDYTEVSPLQHTVLTEVTAQPAQATITLASLAHAVNQGGDIRIIEPPVATVTIDGLAPNFPRSTDAAEIIVIGLAPELLTTLVVEPLIGTLSIIGNASVLSSPFAWVDDSPPNPVVWIDEPRT